MLSSLTAHSNVRSLLYDPAFNRLTSDKLRSTKTHRKQKEQIREKHPLHQASKLTPKKCRQGEGEKTLCENGGNSMSKWISAQGINVDKWKCTHIER